MNFIKLELCREVESGAHSAALFDGFLPIRSNIEALVERSAFDIALHKRCKPAELRGLFCVWSANEKKTSISNLDISNAGQGDGLL